MTETTPLPDAQAYPKRPSGVRFWVLAGLAVAAAGSYLTRVSISTAATTIQRDLSLSNETMGQLMSAFFLGYLIFQVPTGWLCGRLGARITFPLISLLWSLCSLWSGLATSVASLVSARLFCGVAQAGLVPCSSRVVIDWVPPATRGAASAVVASSMSIGAVLASGLTTALLPKLGWRGVFVAYTLVGVIWSVLFYAFFRNRPAEHSSVNSAELDLIRGGTAPENAAATEVKGKPGGRSESRDMLRAMVTSPSMWVICGQAFCRAFGAAFFLTWFPAYLEKARGVEVASAGLFTMLPLAGTVIGNVLGGGVVDVLLARTGNKWISRSGTSIVALALCAVCTLLSSQARGSLPAVIFLAMGSLFFGLGSPAAWAAAMDISGKHTPVVFGIMNMSGNFGAMICPTILGYLFTYIQKSGADWNLVLYLFAAVYGLGALCWLGFNPHRSAVELPTPQTT